MSILSSVRQWWSPAPAPPPPPPPHRAPDVVSMARSNVPASAAPSALYESGLAQPFENFFALGVPGASTTISRRRALSFAAAFRAVTLISGLAAPLITGGGLRVEYADGREARTPAARRALDLLGGRPDGVNDSQSWAEDLILELLLDGNALVHVVRDHSGVTRLDRLLSRWAWIERVGDTPERIYRATLAERPHVQRQVEAAGRDVIHARWPRLWETGYDAREGFAPPPLWVVRPATEIGILMDQLVLDYLRRGDRGNLHLNVKRAMNEQQYRDYLVRLKQWQSSAAPLVTDVETEAGVLTGAASGAAYSSREQREWQMEEVARVFGIPPVLLGRDGNAANKSAAELGRLFLKFGLRPHINRILSAFSATLLPRGQRFIPDYFELLRGDYHELSALVTATLGDAQRGGVLSRRELRRALGRPIRESDSDDLQEPMPARSLPAAHHPPRADQETEDDA